MSWFHAFHNWANKLPNWNIILNFHWVRCFFLCQRPEWMNSRNSVLAVFFLLFFLKSAIWKDAVHYKQHSLSGRNNKQQEDKVQLFVYLLHAGGCILMTQWPAQGQYDHRSSNCKAVTWIPQRKNAAVSSSFCIPSYFRMHALMLFVKFTPIIF